MTVERFGTLTPETQEDSGFIYEGDAWLLRFVTQSVDRFFQAELPNLCEVLNLDIRSIYQLDLFGDGAGLYDVRLYVSFEAGGEPKNEQIDRLKLAVSDSQTSGYKGDMMDDRVLEFLKRAKRSDKRRFAKAIGKENNRVPDKS